MKILKTLIFAFLAGVCISIGGTAFLSCSDKTVGALFFTVGLFIIVTNGFNLFTGKICYVFENPPSYIGSCCLIWLGNLAGTFAAGRLLLLTRIGESMSDKAFKMCETKLSDGHLSLFILAFFCNMLIFIAVDGYKNNPHEVGKYLSLFFGVAVFIICSFEHCVADMFYFTVGNAWNIDAVTALAVITLGNILGGIFIPLCKMCNKKTQ